MRTDLKALRVSKLSANFNLFTFKYVCQSKFVCMFFFLNSYNSIYSFYFEIISELFFWLHTLYT